MFNRKVAVSIEKTRALIEKQTSIESAVHSANQYQRNSQKAASTDVNASIAEPSSNAPITFNGVMNELSVGCKGNAFVDDVGNIKPISYGLIALQLKSCISLGKSTEIND